MCGSTSPGPHSVLLETGLPPSRLGLEITEILGYLVGRPLPIKNYTALTGQPESERPDKLD